MQALKYFSVGIISLVLIVLLPSIRSFRPDNTPSLSLSGSYHQGIDLLIQQLSDLESMVEQADQQEVQSHFLAIRESYKKIEFISTYLEPQLAVQRINGAPLPKVDPMEENVPEVIDPSGLQVIDETLFLGEWNQENRQAIQVLTKKLSKEFSLMKYYHSSKSFTDRQLFEAMRDELIRMYTLGLTGFDTPGSGAAMTDALTVMTTLQTGISLYAEQASRLNQTFSTDLTGISAAAVEYLQAHQDFDTFDRLAFLKEYLDPLFGGLYHLQLALDIETMYEVSNFAPAINYRATQLFSDTLLLPTTYLGYEAAQMKPEVIKLGKLLFFDPILSNDLSRSCASCHNPNKAFSDGQRKSIATGMEGDVGRNSPGLINSSYSDRFFHDLRTFELEMQIDHVVSSELEFNTRYIEILNRLKQSDEYRRLFNEAFPQYGIGGRSTINVSSLKSAMASYVGSLRSFNSPFDKYARGETDQLPESAKRGYNLFMGKAVCGTCHFAPAFTGLVPPDFQDSESEILGVPAAPVWENATLDGDLGRRGNGVPLDAVDIFAFSFKTPSVRNVALTAPYMHNGVYDSLEQVVRFYNVGGGNGIGIELEYQTLPFDNLNLSSGEMADLVSFMETLTDTTGLTGIPSRLPLFDNHPEWNARIIGGEY